jgi:hypothetical protein
MTMAENNIVIKITSEADLDSAQKALQDLTKRAEEQEVALEKLSLEEAKSAENLKKEIKDREKLSRAHDTILKYRVLHDTETVKEYVHDSIPYPIEVTKEVRQRNGYDRFTSCGFWILALLLCARMAWWAFKTFYLRR